jgi:DNA-directed RNA polymerase subunit beta
VQVLLNRIAQRFAFAKDFKDISYVRIDRTRKIPLTTLVRALGFGSDDTIFEIFG